MYDRMAQPVGKYRSKLERDWANWFTLYRVPHEYADAHWYDFRVGEWLVEIKPQGQEYLEQAMARMPGASALAVIQGSPGWCVAWVCVRRGCVIQYESISLTELFGLHLPDVQWQKQPAKMDAVIRKKFGNAFLGE